METNPLMKMQRPLVHGEQRSAWGKTEFNVLEQRQKATSTEEHS
jgi:hypothetical protein